VDALSQPEGAWGCLTATGEVSGLSGRVTVRSVEEGAAARMVLTSSGTMSLACALAGVPGAIVYRANSDNLPGRAQRVKVPYLGIANLLLGETAWPEFIQDQAKPVAIAARLLECEGPEARAKAQEAAVKLRLLLGEPAVAPDAAARWLDEKLFAPTAALSK